VDTPAIQIIGIAKKLIRNRGIDFNIFKEICLFSFEVFSLICIASCHICIISSYFQSASSFLNLFSMSALHQAS